MKSKKNPKLLIFTSLLFILFLHFLLFFKFSKPYPSLIFPSFASVPKKEGEFNTSSNQLFAITIENDTLGVNEKAFFKDVIPGHIRYLLKGLIYKSAVPTSYTNNEKEEFKQYSLKRLNEQYPKTYFKSLMILKTNTLHKVKNGSISKQLIDQQKSIIDL